MRAMSRRRTRRRRLLATVRHTLARCCVLPTGTPTSPSRCSPPTHAAAAFDFALRLVLTFPEECSGKTRCMAIVGHLSHRPLWTANASTGAIYRSPDTPCTLLLDEADTIFSRWADERLHGPRLAMLLEPYGIAVDRNPSTTRRQRDCRRADFTS